MRSGERAFSEITSHASFTCVFWGYGYLFIIMVIIFKAYWEMYLFVWGFDPPGYMSLR